MFLHPFFFGRIPEPKKALGQKGPCADMCFTRGWFDETYGDCGFFVSWGAIQVGSVVAGDTAGAEPVWS